MKIALWDIAAPLKPRLAPLLDPSDVFVDIPASAAEPVAVDVVIASRFAAKDADRATYRLLQAPGAGTDKIDFDAVLPEASVCNAYEHEWPIAEYVFAAILDHAIGYGEMTGRIADQGWGGAYFSRPPHGEIAGRTLGLVGLGHIGAAIAKRARAFGMTVMAVTASGRTASPDVDWIATASKLPELLARTDYLVLACPLTEATRGLLAMPQFKQMKPTAFLVNVARAEVADEADLFSALKDGIIGGAVLDAWYAYPTSADDAATQPSRFPFGSLPTVRMTPHSAAWTGGVWDRRCVVFADNINRLRTDEPLLNVVRPPLDVRAAAGKGAV